MAFAAGIISAVILSKKHPNYKTRLERLQKKLSEKRPKAMVLYEIPMKQLFQVVLILAFIAFLKYFQNEYQKEANQNLFESYEKEFESEIQKFEKVSSTISYMISIQILYLSCLLVWKQTNVKRVKVYPEYITIDTFSILELRKRNMITVQKSSFINVSRNQYATQSIQQNPEAFQKDISNYEREVELRIFQQGSNKFTNVNYNYKIKLTHSYKSNGIMIKQVSQQIIKKGDIFHARKALIEICSVLKISPNLKVKIVK